MRVGKAFKSCSTAKSMQKDFSFQKILVQDKDKDKYEDKDKDKDKDIA